MLFQRRYPFIGSAKFWYRVNTWVLAHPAPYALIGAALQRCWRSIRSDSGWRCWSALPSSCSPGGTSLWDQDAWSSSAGCAFTRGGCKTEADRRNKHRVLGKAEYRPALGRSRLRSARA